MLFAILSILTVSICNGQSAEELNKESKDFILKNDFKNAVPLIKKAAEGGNAEAQYNYGVCFQEGDEVTKNDTIANSWFLKSAMQGWKDAEFKIAYSYAAGRGFVKNDSQAFYWSVKCAAQKDPDCMFNVVYCYHEGVGIGKNIDSMLAWAIRLGSLHDVENLELSGRITSARANLAVMYRNGDNVEKNLVKSYMWYLIYNESKRDFSFPDQSKNIDEIKEVEKELTQTDKEKAKLDAEKQLGRKLKNLDKLYKTEIG